MSIKEGLSDCIQALKRAFNQSENKLFEEDYFKNTSFSSLLPFESFHEEHELFYNKSSIGFSLEITPLVGSDDTIQREVMSFFQEVMEEDSNLQFLLFSDHRIEPFVDVWASAKKNEGGVYFDLAQKRKEFLLENNSSSPRLFRSVISYSVPIRRKGSEECFRKVNSVKESVLKSLSAFTHAFAWKPSDFLNFLDIFVNFNLSTKASKRNWNQFETLSAQLPTGGKVSINEDSLSWKKEGSEVDFVSLKVADFPREWSLASMQHLIGDLFKDSYRLHMPFFIHYGVHIPNQEKAEKKYMKKMFLSENQSKSSFLMRMIPLLREEIKEHDFVRKRLSQSHRFAWTQLGVGFWTTKEERHSNEQSIKGLFRSNEFIFSENTCLQLPIFLSSLPMTWSEYVPDLYDLGVLKTTITSECANLVPIQGEWYGTPTPGSILVGRRGQLLNWNPFDNQSGNYNVTVVGRSGSGKSVFMQDLLMNALGVGTKVFVIEVGRSFEKMNSILQGQYIEFTTKSSLCLNPFTQIQGSQEDIQDFLTMIKSVVATMAAPLKGTTDYENAIIEKAIHCAWEEKGNKATISDIARHLELFDDDVSKRLSVMLLPYTNKGVYSRYFEGENNVNFNSPMVLIELEELKEKRDLQSVVLQLFIMTITNQAFLGDRQTPFHICIDEAWDLLRAKQTGVFIETLARRLRKYNGSLVIGTQSIEDFYAAPGAQAAFENSDWMCLLSQKSSSIQRLAESGKADLSEGQRLALQSVKTRHGEYSEVMICDAEGNYSISRLILDPFSNLLFTTKADEYSYIKQLQEKGLSLTESIEQVVSYRGRGEKLEAV
jgi:conjugal transfer ATP-binding protein TraC